MIQSDSTEKELSKNAERIKEVITKILKEFNLEEKQKKGISDFISGSGEIKDFSDLPSGKIIRIIKENWEKDPSEKELSPFIKESLEVSPEEAEKIASIIKKDVFENKDSSFDEDERSENDSYREPIE